MFSPQKWEVQFQGKVYDLCEMARTRYLNEPYGAAWSRAFDVEEFLDECVERVRDALYRTAEASDEHDVYDGRLGRSVGPGGASAFLYRLDFRGDCRKSQSD